MATRDAVFLIIIHDVADPFYIEVKEILERIRPLVDSHFACAVTPRWHGTQLAKEDSLLHLIEDCDEHMLHGWTHYRDHEPGLISRFTGRADEFGGLNADEIQTRIDRSIEELVSLTGRNICGLVPPAWQLPVPAAALQRLSYVMRYGQLESCHQQSDFRRLATWSFDWGWLRCAEWAGNISGSLRYQFFADTVPCIVIHPVDVQHGWMLRIVELIQRFLDLGHRPITPLELHLKMSQMETTRSASIP